MLGQFDERRMLPAAERKDLETETLAVFDKPFVQGFGLEPLGNGGQPTPLLNTPHAGHVPITAVGQRQYRAMTCCHCFFQMFLALDQRMQRLTCRDQVHRR